jgi:hypothetical protein
MKLAFGNKSSLIRFVPLLRRQMMTVRKVIGFVLLAWRLIKSTEKQISDSPGIESGSHWRHHATHIFVSFKMFIMFVSAPDVAYESV